MVSVGVMDLSDVAVGAIDSGGVGGNEAGFEGA